MHSCKQPFTAKQQQLLLKGSQHHTIGYSWAHVQFTALGDPGASLRWPLLSGPESALGTPQRQIRSTQQQSRVMQARSGSGSYQHPKLQLIVKQLLTWAVVANHTARQTSQLHRMPRTRAPEKPRLTFLTPRLTALRTYKHKCRKCQAGIVGVHISHLQMMQYLMLPLTACEWHAIRVRTRNTMSFCLLSSASVHGFWEPRVGSQTGSRGLYSIQRVGSYP